MDLMNPHSIPKRAYVVSAVVVAVGALFAGAFLLGRGTAPTHSGTWVDGNAVGYDEGVSVGRALQVGSVLPAGTKDVATKAFQEGYRAGLIDSFGSYDGGWSLGRPYVVVIGKGVDDAPYRIDQRDLLRPGVTYQVCKDGTAVCPS
jgi:hypothetical protein